MNGLQIFDNPAFGEVRTLIEPDGKVLFCGNDVAKALGYARPSEAITDHCRYTVKRRIPHPQSKTKTIDMNFIPEGDIYRLAAKSELPGADKFESWIFDEVLPSIRKHGMYAIDELLDNPDLLIEAATKLKMEREKSRQLEAEKRRLQIELDSSKEWYSIKRVAALNGVSWMSFDWRKLKATGEKIGYSVHKIFDANYGEVNTYHRSVWEKAYPEYEL